tara:strand:+ start:21049 stop:22173 length:1125 start_codon:yes stop_codon:yes gene_type:complete
MEIPEEKVFMKLGVPKEKNSEESRVAITPDIAKTLISTGLEVIVESGAGDRANFSDDMYIESGASIRDSLNTLSCDVVIKVTRPSLSEVDAMIEGGIFIGLMEYCKNEDLNQKMADKNISVIALEKIPRISRAQSMDVLSSQANIAGYRAVIEAASHFGRFVPLMMTSAGSAKPAKVVVLGAGVAGLQAIATARRLGGDVYAYDVRPETKEQIESLGAKAIFLDIGDTGSGDGGYAKELSEDTKKQQQKLLAEEISRASIVISTALIPCRPAPELITEEMVMSMRRGSVIVDMAAGSGGNCKLSEPNNIVEKHGVLLIGHTNYPSLMPTDASSFFAKNIANLLSIVIDSSGDTLKVNNLDDDEITSAAQIRISS